MAVDYDSIGKQFKTVWDNKMQDAVRVEALLQMNGFIGDAPGEQLGDFFASPIKVKQGSKRTYRGTNSGVVVLDQLGGDPTVQQAQVYSSAGTLLLRAADDAIDRGDGAAFLNTLVLMAQDLQDSTQQAIEMSALWGQSNYGLVNGAPVNTSGTTYTVAIKRAEWIAAYWATQQDALFEFFNGTTIRTGAGGVALYGKVTGVDFDTYTVTFEMNVGSSTVADGDRIFPKGALVTGGTYKEMLGLATQFSATSGTLFNINRANFVLMQGNTYPLEGTPFSRTWVPKIATRIINKGNNQRKVLFVSPDSWASLDIEEMAIQRRDQSYTPGKAQSGQDDNAFKFANLRGGISVVCHPYMKLGYAMMFTPEHLAWVKARKPGFVNNGDGSKDRYTYRIPGSSGIESQYVWNQACLARLPSQAVLITDIDDAIS